METATIKRTGRTAGGKNVIDQLKEGGMSSIPGLSNVVSDYVNTYRMTPDEAVAYYCGKNKARHTFMMVITPEDAKQLLERNNNNRKLSRDIVRKYAKSMSDGKWEPNADMIAFNEEGCLVNGQHRLFAIVESGKSIDCFIGCNIPFSIQQDRLYKRTIAQNIFIAHDRYGFNNPYFWDHRLVEMCSFILNHMRLNGKDTETVVSFMKENQDALENFANVMLNKRYPKMSKSGINSSSFLAATFCAYLNNVDLEFLSNCRDALATGQFNITKDNSGRFDEIARFRDTVIDYGFADATNKESFFTEFSAYIYAAYKYIKFNKRGTRKEPICNMAIQTFSIKFSGSNIIFPIVKDYKRKK